MLDIYCKLTYTKSMKVDKGYIMKFTVLAGRYFVGDVSGLSRPLVAIPARASVLYTDDGDFEIEIAGGAASMYDENAFGLLGMIEYDASGLEEEDFEFYGVEITEDTEVIADADYFEIVGVMKIGVVREMGVTFTATVDPVLYDGE